MKKEMEKPFIVLGAPGASLINNKSPYFWHMDFCLITYNSQKQFSGHSGYFPLNF